MTGHWVAAWFGLWDSDSDHEKTFSQEQRIPDSAYHGLDPRARRRSWGLDPLLNPLEGRAPSFWLRAGLQSDVEHGIGTRCDQPIGLRLS